MAFVLPAAIQFQTTVAIATRLDGQLVLQSQNYGETVELTLADWPWKACNHGSDYVIQHRPLPEGVAPAICSSMARHDLPRFGQLMYASHASLRDDFQVSCRKLDVLVELAGKIRGGYAARMTGGGFGGCTINLVENREGDSFRAKMAEVSERATGIRPEI